MITGTKEQVRAVADLVDTESGLPVASVLYPCVCGHHAIQVSDHAACKIRCRKCGRVTPAGDRAATIQVEAVLADGSYPASKDLEDRVAAARGKQAKDRTAEEKVLAAASVASIEGDVGRVR